MKGQNPLSPSLARGPMLTPVERPTLPAAFDWNSIYTGHESDLMPPDPLVLELALASSTPGRVLDVGCGAGGLLRALAEAGWKAHGIDIAPRAIEAARRVLGPDATLEVANAATWDPPTTYDLVTNCFAMPLTRSEQDAALSCIRHAVAPGGIAIVKDFDPAMARISHFRGMDLISVAQLTEAFRGFELLHAEQVPTPIHDHGQGRSGDERWTASLLVARRPS